MLLAVRFLIFFTLINGIMLFRTSDKKTLRYFEKRSVEVGIHYIDYGGRPVRYLETGGEPAGDGLVIFVHGAPGAADNFYRYLADPALLARARLIAIDRLGYGYSDYGRAETSLAVQADQIRQVLDNYPGLKAVLVGHSFGGPIVARCAIDFPERIAAVVMLAPVNDPASEPVFWFSHLARWQPTRRMLPPALQVAGDEKFSHVEELKKLEEDWASLRVPVVHIHGKRDFLAPPANIDFSCRHIPERYLKLIVLPHAGHFIPWTNYRLVRDELLLLLK